MNPGPPGGSDGTGPVRSLACEATGWARRCRVTPVDDGSLDIDMLAASLHADGGDVRILLKALVSKLADALGDRMSVERAGGLLHKSDDVKRVSIKLGDDELDAQIVSGALECVVARCSGGIRIRSAKVPMDEWLRQLLGALAAEAQTSETTRTALEGIVIGGQG